MFVGAYKIQITVHSIKIINNNKIIINIIIYYYYYDDDDEKISYSSFQDSNVQRYFCFCNILLSESLTWAN